MLKHRVSNAGSHVPPPTITRPAPPVPTDSPRQTTAKVQPPVPKPPRVNPEAVHSPESGHNDSGNTDLYPQYTNNAAQYQAATSGVTNTNASNSTTQDAAMNGQTQTHQSQNVQYNYGQPYSQPNEDRNHQVYTQEYSQQQQYTQQQQRQQFAALQGQSVQQHPQTQVVPGGQPYHQQQGHYGQSYTQQQTYTGQQPPPVQAYNGQPSYNPQINGEQPPYQAQTSYSVSSNQSQFNFNQTDQSQSHNNQSYQQVPTNNALSYSQTQKHNEPAGQAMPQNDRIQNGAGVQGPIPVIKTENGDSCIEGDRSIAKEGIRVINEKYDTIGNLATSTGRSPMSSPTTESAPLSLTEIIMSQKFREGVTEQDLLQVDTFYRGHKSEVHVCNCLANMYIGNVKTLQSTEEQWTFVATGIPLFLLDTGEHHRERKLYIILAEKGTGFSLWRDVIDNLTNYKTPNPNFHTMHTSKDHTKLAGFSFDEADKAKEFYRYLESITSDPNDELLKIGKGKKKKSMKDKKKKLKLPKKTEISQPCCFVHVTKLERPASETEEAGKQSPDEKISPDANGISKPFNFQHVTASHGSGSSVIPKSESLSNVMGSKLTLTSASSVDSGLSDDRSTRTANS